MTLQANASALWLQAWRLAVRKCVATAVVSTINLDDSSIAAGWRRFDDPAGKAQLVTADSDLHDSCIAELLKIHEPLNAALQQSGFDRRTRPKMERHLRIILPKLIQQPMSNAEIATNPLPGAWKTAADLLAQKAYCQSAQEPSSYSETRLHNILLLSGLFLACQYSTAAEVEIAMGQLGRSMLSIRGSMSKNRGERLRVWGRGPDPAFEYPVWRHSPSTRRLVGSPPGNC